MLIHVLHCWWIYRTKYYIQLVNQNDEMLCSLSVAQSPGESETERPEEVWICIVVFHLNIVIR